MRHLTEPHGTTQFNLCRIMSLKINKSYVRTKVIVPLLRLTAESAYHYGLGAAAGVQPVCPEDCIPGEPAQAPLKKLKARAVSKPLSFSTAVMKRTPNSGVSKV